MNISETSPAGSGTKSKERNTFKWIFCDSLGLRIGWKVLLFVFIAFGLFLATKPLIDLAAPRPGKFLTPLETDLIREFWFVLIVILDTWILARLEKRPLRFYGYSDPKGLKRFFFGACWGFVGISALVGSLWLHGSLIIDDALSVSHNIILNSIASLLLYLVVGLAEESLLRGYLQFALSRAIGFW